MPSTDGDHARPTKDGDRDLVILGFCLLAIAMISLDTLFSVLLALSLLGIHGWLWTTKGMIGLSVFIACCAAATCLCFYGISEARRQGLHEASQADQYRRTGVWQ